MDLFVINRYFGDDVNHIQAPNEDALREKLFKKIKARKENGQILALENCNGKNSKVQKDASIKTEVEVRSKQKPKNLAVDNETCTFFMSIPGNEKVAEPNNDNNNKNIQQNLDHVYNGEKEKPGFTILGDAQMHRKAKIKRRLPNWLAHPSVVSVDLKNLKHSVDSIPELERIFVDRLKENNITHFFPVQSQVIPWLLRHSERPQSLRPNDICVSAPTGSGKTLAFVLPILQILCKRVVPRIRALVVLPVQDLANQVYRVFEIYSKPTCLTILLLSKKRPFKEEQSLICKKDGMGGYKILVDILVTTPGRLVEHLTLTEGLNLESLRYLVIDEADRVMEKIQNDWLFHLNKHMNLDCSRSYQVPVIGYNSLKKRNKPPNKLLFSATLSQDPEKLQQLGLFQPKLFTSIVKADNENNCLKDLQVETKFIGKYTTPAELTEYFAVSKKAEKPLLVHHLLHTKQWRNVLCFVNSSEATVRLSYILKCLSNKALSIGNLSAFLGVRERDSILEKFSSGKIDVLVSSDALARGIDIPNVQYVISYDAPKFVKTYVHRIGRTGRAGKEGTSLVLLTPKEINKFQKMIDEAGKSSVEELKINPTELKAYSASYVTALQSLRGMIRKKIQKKVLKDKKTKRLQMQAFQKKYSKTIKKNFL